VTGGPAALAAAAFAAAPIHWHASVSLGTPSQGRLVHGVRLPADGRRFFTWDPVLRRSPDRAWRRYGSDRLVRTVLTVVDGFAAAHPGAPRVGIGDLSRPRGGDFGIRYGPPGHVSHQNGLDVDVYYPRRDGRERAPVSVAQIDRPLAQDLVRRFVRAGATNVFVGPETRLRGPARVVQVLAHHDNHMHVRIANDRSVESFGRTAAGRPLRVWRIGTAAGRRRVLVVGCIHGTECAGMAVTRRLVDLVSPVPTELWIVPNLNPDGLAAYTRQNARGVDLNRNFPSEWRAVGRRWDPQYPGPRPLSEPESRAVAGLIRRIRPDITIWYHQPQAIVRAWGRSIRAARQFARLAGTPFRAMRWPNGTAPNWQNHVFAGSSSFVVELPAGPLAHPAAVRQVRAILALASARAPGR
jgi:murein endopeptidase